MHGTGVRDVLPDMKKSWTELAPDDELTRHEAAVALTAAGHSISGNMLAASASRGTGPRYRRVAGIALYRWEDLITWAEARSTPRATKASDIPHPRYRAHPRYRDRKGGGSGAAP